MLQHLLTSIIYGRCSNSIVNTHDLAGQRMVVQFVAKLLAFRLETLERGMAFRGIRTSSVWSLER